MKEFSFVRSPQNPILTASDRWWEARAVFNPGVVVEDGRIALVYRAVGADGISRFGLAWTADGEHIEERHPLPIYEAALDDPAARLGVEDPRVVHLEGAYWLTYCKAAVEEASTPPLSWETAPFRVRSALAHAATLRANEEPSIHEIGLILPERNSKDAVMFPERVEGRLAFLIREYPSIQFLTSDDHEGWSEPQPVMEPIPGTWEGERIGAGPPPLRTPWGWVLFYHGNEYLHLPGNRRSYAMGLAVLDLADPTRVLYRHPEPIMRPEAPYEIEGPVGNVVFGTGLVERSGRLFLYYGAGDGVIGVAMAEMDTLLRFVQEAVGST